jgi:hypothetical protein
MSLNEKAETNHLELGLGKGDDSPSLVDGTPGELVAEADEDFEFTIAKFLACLVSDFTRREAML